jgi:hypothetical protein
MSCPSSPGGPYTIYQPAWIDGCGNLHFNGRTAATLAIAFQDGAGNPLDVSQSILEFEVQDTFQTLLTPIVGFPDRQLLVLTQSEVALVDISGNPKIGPYFVLRDITTGDDLGVVRWEGMFIVRAYTDEPTLVEPAPAMGRGFVRV